jgi:hypothetical protein
MEAPPNLSFSEVTSLFTDLSHEQQRQELLNAFPYHQPNQITSESNYDQARSVTSHEAQFRDSDFEEGARMLNGQLQYPFQSTVELWTNKSDPFYFDGSENNSVFNLQENLIGKVLGADLLEDPNKTYTENILALKENHGKQTILNDDYIKNLFMLNVDKGSKYYSESVRRETENLALHTREERERKNNEVAEIDYGRDYPMGQFNHPNTIPNARIHLPSASAYLVANYRQRIMDRKFTERQQMELNAQRTAAWLSGSPSISPQTGYAKMAIRGAGINPMYAKGKRSASPPSTPLVPYTPGSATSASSSGSAGRPRRARSTSPPGRKQVDSSQDPPVETRLGKAKRVAKPTKLFTPDPKAKGGEKVATKAGRWH